MTERVKATIEFKMPEEWVATGHPVGDTIQRLYAELAKAYLALDHARGNGRWAEWAESYEDVED